MAMKQRNLRCSVVAVYMHSPCPTVPGRREEEKEEREIDFSDVKWIRFHMNL
jgi:hypothetical protein